MRVPEYSEIDSLIPKIEDGCKKCFLMRLAALSSLKLMKSLTLKELSLVIILMELILIQESINKLLILRLWYRKLLNSLRSIIAMSRFKCIWSCSWMLLIMFPESPELSDNLLVTAFCLVLVVVEDNLFQDYLPSWQTIKCSRLKSSKDTECKTGEMMSRNAFYRQVLKTN